MSKTKPSAEPARSSTLWVVCGPTASGKTGFAIELATRLNAEILSFDSRQWYRELNIGVARPGPEELAAVPHHFIAEGSIYSPWNAGSFARLARTFLEAYFEKKQHAVLAGGTGLYLKALLEGLNRAPADEQLRRTVEELFREEGTEGLARALMQEAADMEAIAGSGNPARMMRALEWVRAGRPSSGHEPLPRNWTVRKMALDRPRPELYRRINERTDAMLAAGLWEEAAALFPFRHLPALHTVGYREIFEALENRMSRAEAEEKIRQHTRNYAKRQLTWFRRDPETEWIKPEETGAWIERNVPG
jgi:tRNA dimethylallyltransferase